MRKILFRVSDVNLSCISVTDVLVVVTNDISATEAKATSELTLQRGPVFRQGADFFPTGICPQLELNCCLSSQYAFLRL